MNATTHNTVTIINSNISKSVVQITQSGKDAIWKEIAQKLQEVVNSEDIKGLPEQTRLDVLDQAEAVIDQLNKPVTDVGKVQRGLKEARRVHLIRSLQVARRHCYTVGDEGPWNVRSIAGGSEEVVG